MAFMWAVLHDDGVMVEFFHFSIASRWASLEAVTEVQCLVIETREFAYDILVEQHLFI